MMQQTFVYHESVSNKHVSNIKQTCTTINKLHNKCNNMNFYKKKE